MDNINIVCFMKIGYKVNSLAKIALAALLPFIGTKLQRKSETTKRTTR
jgi:hypothetical protein